jgi:membrane protein implicated in regulation of membrane protease activity
VLATAGATLCLIAPTAHHRLRFRSGVKEQLIRVANALTLLGLVLLAFAVSAATYVVTDLIYPGTLPRVVAGSLAGAFVVAWFVVPLLYRRERTPEPRSPGRGD